MFIKRSNESNMFCMLTLYVRKNTLVESSKHDLQYFGTSYSFSKTLQNSAKLKIQTILLIYDFLFIASIF